MKKVPVYKASHVQTWKLLQGIADKMAPKMRRQFLAAMGQVKSQIKLKELASAIQTGQIALVERALALETSIPMAVKRSISDGVREIVVAAGQASIGLAPKTLQSALRFDMLAPRTVDFLRQYEFNLIEGITKQTREGVRQAIINAFEQGRHPYETAQELKRVIGLNQRQVVAADNYRQMLIDEGQTGKRVKEFYDKYVDDLLDSRAKTIARTETLRAANAGYDELWNQAAEAGLVDAYLVRREWIVTPDDRLCPACQSIPEMNPKGVKLDEDFRSIDGPIHSPPLHPNCRCVTVLIFND